jgi:hypothetical protein
MRVPNFTIDFIKYQEIWRDSSGKEMSTGEFIAAIFRAFIDYGELGIKFQ